MLDATLPIISGWQNFYLITGPSAAALIGLQFVVMALAKETPLPTSTEGIGAFSTPTVVHFSAILTIAAVLSAPWTSLQAIALVIGIGSVVGALYTLVVARRIRSSTHAYTPVMEDWLFHAVLPLVAYILLAVAALVMPTHVRGALFGIAAMVLVLLFTAIHNAWDTAAYLSLGARTSVSPSAPSQ